MAKNNYNNWTKEQLVDEVARLRKRKKYGLVWEDKPEDVVEQCKTELPVLKEVKNKAIAKDKNGPVNILIEGDNYHALSVLNYTHKGKIDVIYIDPPYNTGNKDFIYNDNFVDAEDPYRHTKWLSFMEKRLKLAKNLLKRTGVIFMSIDDNESAQLKLLADDIFKGGFIATIIWEKKFSPQNDVKWFSDNHDYLLVYAKNKESWRPNLLPRTEVANSRYSNPDNDPRGDWTSADMTVKTYSAKYDYPIKTPSGRVVNPTKGRCWAMPRERVDELVKENRIWFGESGGNVPRVKIFLSEVKEGIVPLTIWRYTEAGHNQEARQELKNILHDTMFDNPKPTKLIKKVLQVSSAKHSVVLDFFAGSGTTGHAVLELNKEDGGNRRFILCTDDQDNNGSGTKIAVDICYPRVAKVIEGYKDAKGKSVAGLGGNFKYFRTAFVGAESNDKNKEALTKQATEMLCMREDTFEPVKDTETVKIFKNSNQHTGIVFDEDAIPAFKKEIAKIGGVWSVYIFSLGDDTFEDEFGEMKQKITVAPIPEAILRVYRRLFKV
ncbi:MAG: site-specific DNA-methyltransferase [Candidatus Sungbacteria bacterium]|nr:site-specific DNA-methyltransferase [Candidatus Sungbacteria bacterium]